MSKRLNISPILQPINKPYCGFACANMVFCFYGQPARPYDEIISKIHTTETGAWLQDLGILFLKEGFDAIISAWSPTFPNYFSRLKFEEIRPELDRWCTDKTVIGRHIHKNNLGVFFAHGGILVPRPVKISQIIDAIDNDIPAILNLQVGLLWQHSHNHESRHGGHYVIPIAVEGEKVTIIDPSWRPGIGGVKEYERDEIMHACYSWSSGAIFVAPKGEVERLLKILGIK